MRLEVGLSLPAVAEAQAAAEAWLAGQGVAPSLAQRSRLVVEELLVNLVQHARFAGPRLPARLELALEGGALRVAIEDAAEPFDPRGPTDPPPESLQGAREGGFGLPLVRRLAPSLGYGRTAAGWNRTELTLPAEG